jgi:signal transduction histidine kinase/CheY-like chemotaxis protein
VYQVSKFASLWWLLEGALLFTGVAIGRSRSHWIVGILIFLALASVVLTDDIEDLLIFQSPLNVAGGVAAAVLLARIPRSRRSLGTRLTSSMLLAQAALWVVYFVAFVFHQDGVWPVDRSAWVILKAHNSYFDLALDVLVASSLVVLLLQDLHRRQLEAEAERSKLQSELNRSQRLRSLGTLVSGVAHELNNPLAAILGFAETLSLDTSAEERDRAANVIREQALRCRRIVRGLASFSGKETEVLEKIEISSLFERVRRGFEFELASRKVAVVIQASSALPHVTGDRYALEQLLTNLLANAIQVSPPHSRVSLSAGAESGQMVIRVEDEGPGIPAETLMRVFDPFFTTKTPGTGMGLGLAVAHGIAQSHGGSIRAENRHPRGARFTLFLPVRRQADEPLQQKDIPRPSPPAPVEPRRARALELLVIEDETLLCRLMKSMGEQRGWRVTAVESGREGLALLEAHPERFDVVLCDLRMAPPSGIEIHDRLRGRPEILERFLFATGDVSSEEATAFAARCLRPILCKPLSLAELTRAIEEVAARRLAGSASG